MVELESVETGLDYDYSQRPKLELKIVVNIHMDDVSKEDIIMLGNYINATHRDYKGFSVKAWEHNYMFEKIIALLNEEDTARVNKVKEGLK